MTTLRELLQTEISDLQSELEAKQAQLSTFEGNASTFLDKEAEKVKEFVLGLWGHIFGETPVPTAPVAAPAASVAVAASAPEQTGVTV
jgi:hypothetical protein